MVSEINGDIFAQIHGGECVICHQTNIFGVMGAGIAAAIRGKLLTREQYGEYVRLCESEGCRLLGFVQYFRCDGGIIVANCFCQDEGRQTSYDYNITSYSDMKRCFIKVRDMAERGNLPVYIPYKMGCGIAGGSWETVRSIIDSVFGRSSVHAIIVRRRGD